MKRLIRIIVLHLFVLVAASVAFASDSDEFRALFGPVGNENIPKLKAVLKSGVDVNATGEAGITVLLKAVYLKPNPALVKILPDAGANVNIRADNGWTDLEMARDLGHTELVELMEQQRDVQVENAEWAATANDSELGPYGVAWGFSTEKAAKDAAIERCISEGGSTDACLNDLRWGKKRCVVFATFIQRYVGGTSERIYVTQFGDTHEEALRRLREGTSSTNECFVCEVLVAPCAD